MFGVFSEVLNSPTRFVTILVQAPGEILTFQFSHGSIFKRTLTASTQLDVTSAPVEEDLRLDWS